MNSDQAVSRRLILLRHAKSLWPEGLPDAERPLAERGIADATVAGPVIAEIVPRPDVVLCSPAVRTRQTWRLVAPAFTEPPSVRFEPVIYGATVPELLDLVRAVPAETATVLVLGHEPTMSTTAELIAGPGSDALDLARLRNKYPTSGTAVFAVPAPWSELGAETTVLERFLVPRG